MSVTIVATVGAANANSFVTDAEMTAYCEARLNASVWTGADAQLPALVEATRDLSLLAWKGYRATAVQALAWPRTEVVNPDIPNSVLDPTEQYYDDDVVPQRVKDATCELALQYLLAGTSDIAVADPNAGVIRKRVDVLETEFARPVDRPQGLTRFPRVLQFIGPLLNAAGVGNLLLRRT
jgi:hypothetical protein